MKIGVFGNCQAPGFAASIQALTGHEPHCYTIQKARIASQEELKANAAQFADCDVVFTQPSITQSGFGPLDFVHLRGNCRQIVSYPQMAYTGLQPDCHYIRPNGIAMNGPVGPYHSAIVAASYLEGLPPERAECLFNSYVFAKLGFFEKSRVRDPLIKDAKSLGFDISAFLSGDRGVFMLTINHPSIALIFDVAAQAARIAELRANYNVTPPTDVLRSIAVWPVFPEICHNFGIADDLGAFSYRNIAFSLSEFIARSYQAYQEFGGTFSTPQIETARSLIKADVR